MHDSQTNRMGQAENLTRALAVAVIATELDRKTVKTQRRSLRKLGVTRAGARQFDLQPAGGVYQTTLTCLGLALGTLGGTRFPSAHSRSTLVQACAVTLVAVRSTPDYILAPGLVEAHGVPAIAASLRLFDRLESGPSTPDRDFLSKVWSGPLDSDLFALIGLWAHVTSHFAAGMDVLSPMKSREVEQSRELTEATQDIEEAMHSGQIPEFGERQQDFRAEDTTAPSSTSRDTLPQTDRFDFRYVVGSAISDHPGAARVVDVALAFGVFFYEDLKGDLGLSEAEGELREPVVSSIAQVVALHPALSVSPIPVQQGDLDPQQIFDYLELFGVDGAGLGELHRRIDPALLTKAAVEIRAAMEREGYPMDEAIAMSVPVRLSACFAWIEQNEQLWNRL